MSGHDFCDPSIAHLLGRAGCSQTNQVAGLVVLYQYDEEPVPGLAIELDQASGEIFLRIPTGYLVSPPSVMIGSIHFRHMAYRLWSISCPNLLFVESLTFTSLDEHMFVMRAASINIDISLGSRFYWSINAKNLAREPAWRVE